MKTPTTKKPSDLLKKFFLSSCIVIAELFIANPVYAWSGYDFENSTAIEIDSGNLVREGQVIQFYDLNSDDYYTAQIVMMETAPGGVRITVDDLDNEKKRIFLMNE